MKYGDGVNPNALFNKRIRNGVMVAGILLFFFITKLNYIKIIFAILVGVAIFKYEYINIKSYYKKHLNEIDEMLPHYLKGLEILIQHYTVPVAMGKSMNDAPPIFREGLQQLVNEINAGNDTINPYMEFAKTYPVRDSMRMMRLLYRLSLGRQERKQEQLLAFSRSISSLQQKARDTKYKNRLEKMESKTMHMLVTTGTGVMILLVLAVLQMMSV
jgi:Flp pilus assembly protein TadB